MCNSVRVLRRDEAVMYDQDAGPRSAVEKVLNIFADVRRGEGTTGLLLMTNIFILLTAYYIIKPVREALILSSQGAEIKSYAGAAQALLFLMIVPLYGAVANRLNRVRLVNGLIAFFISNLVLFYFLAKMNFSIGIPFFLWVGLFNVMLVAQVWAFANDIYTQEQGRRLFAITGIGSSLGAIFGAQIAGSLFKPVGPYTMMLVAASMLSLCMVLTSWIHRREKRRPPLRKNRGIDAPIDGKGGFQLIFRYRYLFLIAILVLLSNLVNTTGEFILGKAVKLEAEAAVANPSAAGMTQEEYIGKFYADFYFWVNILGAGLQLFVVSRIMKHIGISAALLFLPIIALGSYGLLAFVPMLSLIRVTKIMENSTDYSIQNTARHALFLRTSRDAKYKAKTAIDNFFWRAGDALSAVLVFVGAQLSFGVRDFAIANIILVAVWLCVAVGIVRMRKTDQVTQPADQAAPEGAIAA